MSCKQRVFLFNPDSEMAIANGSEYYMPPANIALMADELGYLPAYFADEEDLILMNDHPGADFLKSRKDIFGLKNRVINWSDIENVIDGIAEPWGWSPKVCHGLNRLNAPAWNPEWKDLYSRSTARVCLEKFCRELSFVEDTIIPQECRSIDEIVSIAAGGEFVVKAPWSSSGKGLLKIGKEGVTSKAAEWLNGVLRKQGYVMVEKWLDKEYDFAMEYHSDGEGKIDFIGLSAFYTGEGGNYRGNFIGGQERIEKKLEEYIGMANLSGLKSEMVKLLPGILGIKYKGYFGVDMMVYRDGNGNYRVQPCVEINLRYNMGILALFLSQRFVAGGAEGTFSIHCFRNTGEACRMHEENLLAYPLRMHEGKITDGYINLTPVRDRSRFVAVVHVKGKE